jgi:probable rRNA maturation factor
MFDAELSVLIVDDDQMAELNKTYLGRSGPTNVLAFPLREGPFAEVNPNLLGDVVICLDTTFREAEAAGITKPLRFDQLLVHGILHLFGFNHERSDRDANDMKKKEEELVGLLKEQQYTI